MRAHSFPRLLAAAIVAGSAFSIPAGPARADLVAPSAAVDEANDPAARPVRSFYDALLYAMKHAKQLGVNGRYKHLEPAIAQAFDMETMTKLIIGEDWKGLSDTDRKQLVAAFRRVTVADYAHNFDDYGGESFVIGRIDDRSGDKIVSTQMVIPGKAPIAFGYRMHKGTAGWRIIDIYLNGYISEVATRRSDFASTMKSGGASALTAKLEQMAEETLKN